jgi:DNA repair photolyase
MSERTSMNGKPVVNVPALSVVNFDSAFKHKLLCDGLTFSTGSACAYSCSFCYVPDLMRKNPHASNLAQPFEQTVIRREGAIRAMVKQLKSAKGRSLAQQKLVIYASPLVDVAANMELVSETVEACREILDYTAWDIRLLSKSNLLPKVAEQLIPRWKSRVIFGVSTGTLGNDLAKAFEAGTPLVSKRIESLHWLQDHGYRTFGMICPSLPQLDYASFAQEMAAAIRVDRCEHVWAEVINLRGESFKRTLAALNAGGFHQEARILESVTNDKAAWENYARATFEAHCQVIPPSKLRFLQYVTKDSKAWWAARQGEGSVLL